MKTKHFSQATLIAFSVQTQCRTAEESMKTVSDTLTEAMWPKPLKSGITIHLNLKKYD